MKIASVKSLGMRQTYSPEMAGQQHNYLTAGSGAVHKNSHGIAYCLVAYQCLWLKAYFPHEWWASVMSYCNPDKLIRYMNVARGEGVQFKSLDANRLSGHFDTVVAPRKRHDDVSAVGSDVQGGVSGVVMPGILGIKGIGASCLSHCGSGQFSSMDDFVRRLGKNKLLMERLIKLGAFRHLPGHENVRATWIWYKYNYCSGHGEKLLREEIDRKILAEKGWTYDSIMKERIRQEDDYRMLYPKRKKIPGKITNFMPAAHATFEKIKEIYSQDYTLADVLKFEEEFLGYTLHSPVDLFVIRGGRTIARAKEEAADSELEVVIEDVFRCKTRNDSPMMRLTVTDGVQTAVLILWHDQFILVDRSVFRKGVGIRVRVKYDVGRGTFTMHRNCPIITLRRKEDRSV